MDGRGCLPNYVDYSMGHQTQACSKIRFEKRASKNVRFPKKKISRAFPDQTGFLNLSGLVCNAASG